MSKSDLSDVSELYIKFREKIKWFIIQYFGEDRLHFLDKHAEKNNNHILYNELNHIWFALPDNKFNIKENPDGWNEFLNILET